MNVLRFSLGIGLSGLVLGIVGACKSNFDITMVGWFVMSISWVVTLWFYFHATSA